MHKNNFDFLRLLFALFIIITHSYDLAYNTHTKELLSSITSGQISFSEIGLVGFFSISGFLVFESLKRSKSIMSYFKKRVLRIYPGYTVALLITVVVAGLASHYRYYFSNETPYQYFISKFFMFIHPPTIKGAFVNNPVPNEANGSLWSIPLEFSFYIFLSMLFFVRGNKPVVLILTALTFVGSLTVLYGKGTIIPSYLYYYINKPFKIFTYQLFFIFALYFSMGVILSNFKAFLFAHKRIIFFASASLSILFIILNVFSMTSVILLPVLIISFGLMCTKGIGNLSSKIGDISYGVYLYAFLIQQVIVSLFMVGYLELMILTTPIAILCGFLSYHFIEKRLLLAKRNKLVINEIITL